ITLSGVGRDYPPHDEAGFLDYAKSLPTPIIAEAIQRSQPLASIRGNRKMENRNYHYERLAPALDGIIVLGDAFCALNPIYGQGMTMAALGATLLGEWLRSADTHKWVPGPGWSGRFHRKLARAYKLPWLMATGEDYRVSGVDAPPAPFWLSVAHRYFDAVLRVCTSDGDIWRTFLQVANMTRHPAHLIHPRILWATLRFGWSKPGVPAAGPTLPPDEG
ncbi:MAG TPA: hypothetical protein VD886_04840, partial [Herpetosiphonaceae bacterium]|nr:hypothetical protein [Herpetosiphonaceae bacterium]